MSRGVDAVIRYHIAASPLEASAKVLPWNGDISNLQVDIARAGYEGEGPTDAPVDHTEGRMAGNISFYMLGHDWMRPEFWNLKLMRIGWWFYEDGIGSGRPRIYLPSLTTTNIRVRGQHTFFEVIANLHGTPNFAPQT